MSPGFLLHSAGAASPACACEVDTDELTVISRWMDGERSAAGTVVVEPSIHQQEDGTMLAVCATGTSSRDRYIVWLCVCVPLCCSA